MGIPHLFKWFKNKDYKGVLRKSVPSYVSSFSFDFNSILHDVAQTVYAYGKGENPKRRRLVEKADPKILEAEYYQALATKLSEVISQVAPQEILVLAIDGVAPQAKIAQQRQRRFRSAMESSGNSVFNSSAITPGTEFMKRVDNFLQRWLVSSARSLPPKVIYSSHMVPGEGEHKLVSLIRSGAISGDGAHVIYGMDADLIMLSLLAPIDNISLMREDINSIIDINSLRLALKEELATPTSIQDFVVMIFLLGNDFLPHLVAMGDLDEGIETMINTYKKNNRNLTNENDLDWEGLSSYLKALAKEEPRLLELESKRDVKYPSRMMALATTRTEEKTADKITVETKFSYDIFRGAWYKNAFDLKAKKSVFEKLLPDHKFGSTNNKMVDMTKSYLLGMAWVYRYYSKGKEAVNTDYVYRYHYAPLISDISFVANSIKGVTGYHFNPNTLEINPVHQLLAVLPLKSRNLLPYEVIHLTEKDSPIADYYPESEVIERDGMNTDWQGVILINFVDMKRIMHAVETTSLFTEERVNEFSPTYNIVLKRDPDISKLDEKTRKFREYLSKETGRGRGSYNNRGGYNRGRGYDNRGRGRGSYNNRGGYENKGRGRGQYQDKRQKVVSKQKGSRTELPPLPTVSIPVHKPKEVQKFEL